MKEDIPNHRLINRSEIQAPIFSKSAQATYSRGEAMDILSASG